MAQYTTFYYDWNVDIGGNIWPGNILPDPLTPFVRMDMSDEELQAELDENDFGITFNEEGDRRRQTFLSAAYLSGGYNGDSEIKQYQDPSTHIWFVYPCTVSDDTPNYQKYIQYDPWLSSGFNSSKSTVKKIYIYDVNSKQIVGRALDGAMMPHSECTVAAIKWSRDLGLYWDYGGKPYYAWDQTLNKYLHELGFHHVGTWYEDCSLRIFVPFAYGATVTVFHTMGVMYQRKDLVSGEMVKADVQRHDNEIVALWAKVPFVDKINLCTKNKDGKVTSVDYFRVTQNAGLFDVWVKNMHRIYPKYTGKNIDEILDNALADETKAWMTPTEFYNKSQTTTKGVKTGNDGMTIAKVKSKDNETSEKQTVPIWFWSNSLANWCTFKHGERHCTELCVWNGRNGWDPLSDILKPGVKDEWVMETYFYEISRFMKGVILNTKLYRNKRFSYKYVKLPYDSKFSQYDENTFQCVKISRVHLDDKGMGRYPFTTGIPPVMRLPSGELAMIYYLVLPGMTKKHEVIYLDHADFLNSVCLAYFGKGDEKTIKDDWKRFYKLKDVLEEKANDVVTDDVSTLVDAEEINTIHEEADVMNITMNIPRQYPETLDATKESFVEDWRQ